MPGYAVYPPRGLISHQQVFSDHSHGVRRRHPRHDEEKCHEHQECRDGLEPGQLAPGLDVTGNPVGMGQLDNTEEFYIFRVWINCSLVKVCSKFVTTL
jgi:hypothetical protein